VHTREFVLLYISSAAALVLPKRSLGPEAFELLRGMYPPREEA
jgi:hypothetical protein